MATERLVTAQQQPEDDVASNALRPSRIDEYVGQADLLERLRITIEAVKARVSVGPASPEAMEHVLLHGPPGLGKTTLAHVIGNEMGSRVYVTSGPALARGTDLVAALTRLHQGDVLFIDEIHRLPVAVEEFIYPAMEDFRIDVTVDSGLHARTVQIRCKPFTLIGATTRAGLLSAPLRSRFGLVHHLRYYSPDELLTILERTCRVLAIGAPSAAALATIASRSRGTPRIANRLLRRVRDYAQVRANGTITPDLVDEALALEGVDALGLDELDRAYLRVIGSVYEGGPVGLETVAATMNEDAGTLEDVVEPYLLQIGFLARTRRGRALTRAGASHLGIELKPTASSLDAELFSAE
ncbi:MAG: Holliday junction branch migration DNA helicase RuvB [Leptolyngbya sp. PLA2]|nr:Holliday junction branch migration DNA helicase RuvB [Leptolyngbya sp.]MCE7970664.1 Holliday junction branch migration DNA helicase RuvB [Leptolyngbya sp. PL-A2]MCQ3939818.1 Holliday junction branch migration DNA helicase RuvB [cyanobacterium CYA1]MCZ7633385.1 Holliday junction branch migration DNA helicase RuvB [Phycisphaerales bacterium]MDL1903437.1 Holliday junction branch migration DNA helicase RuvB [Synechococcales cyanobacterium CNB]GIK18138.1 MAG: Holliday junction ATP-dependent DNA 